MAINAVRSRWQARALLDCPKSPTLQEQTAFGTLCLWLLGEYGQSNRLDGTSNRTYSMKTQMQIPERIIEAIERGEKLSISRVGKFTASLTNDDPNGTSIYAAAQTIEEALEYLSEFLPLTVREVAMMDVSAKGGDQ